MTRLMTERSRSLIQRKKLNESARLHMSFVCLGRPIGIIHKYLVNEIVSVFVCKTNIRNNEFSLKIVF